MGRCIGLYSEMCEYEEYLQRKRGEWKKKNIWTKTTIIIFTCFIQQTQNKKQSASHGSIASKSK